MGVGMCTKMEDEEEADRLAKIDNIEDDIVIVEHPPATVDDSALPDSTCAIGGADEAEIKAKEEAEKIEQVEADMKAKAEAAAKTAAEEKKKKAAEKGKKKKKAAQDAEKRANEKEQAEDKTKKIEQESEKAKQASEAPDPPAEKPVEKKAEETKPEKKIQQKPAKQSSSGGGSADLNEAVKMLLSKDPDVSVKDALKILKKAKPEWKKIKKGEVSKALYDMRNA